MVCQKVVLKASMLVVMKASEEVSWKAVSRDGALAVSLVVDLAALKVDEMDGKVVEMMVETLERGEVD